MVHSVFSRPELSPAFIKDHNQEAKEVWDAFHSGKPIRPPVKLGTNTQYFIFNRNLNPHLQINFREYMTDPKVMFEFSLKSIVWRAFHVAPYCDDPIELPDEFTLRVDLQNIEEAIYFGAPVKFLTDQVPDSLPILTGEKKYDLFGKSFPDPLRTGWYITAMHIYEEWLEYLALNPTYQDRPIKIEPFGYWTSGFFTMAIALRGMEFLTDIYEDPQYVHDLLAFLTEATIQRVKAFHHFFNLPYPGKDLFFADDAIQLISTKTLKEFLLPHYQHYKNSIVDSEHIKIHLCGDASRHFKCLKDDLGVNDFETGFPIDFGMVRQQLGPEVTIQGGPNVMILKEASPEEVAAETKRILNSGVLTGGKFILREGNNLAPNTPYYNLDAMYQAARQFKF
ncbi:MAG TPA: uroporphyrinogen decarboxylase family protein [Anaerolineaceae bacterium]|nr:uroporphyrinogen decarboxylase family protein [Anaerolineaceae bacterium]